MSFSLSILPKPPAQTKQVIRLYSREQIQVIMDLLLQDFVPIRLAKLSNSPEIPESTYTIEEISKHTGISVRALNNYINRLAKDEQYNPFDHFNESHRAMSLRLEEELLHEIETNYLIPGYYFNNKVLKLLALALWERASDEDKLRKTFRASSGWCRNFRKRHGYVWRKARLSRRPAHTPKSEKIKQDFIKKVTEIRVQLEKDNKLYLLVNIDETAWKICYSGDMTWAKKGSTCVKINVGFNTKEAITTLAAITASGDKLPLYLIAKGKTERAENNLKKELEDHDEILTDHSKSGWTTEDVMLRYLKTFRDIMNEKYNINNSEKIFLLLDVYKSHKSKKVLQAAEELNIDLIFIPAGYTDAYQPLDIKVFGGLKAKARGYWYDHFASDPSMKFTKAVAVKILIKCWKEISLNCVSSAWEQYKQLIAEEEEDSSVVPDIESRSLQETNSAITEGITSLREKQHPVVSNSAKLSEDDEDEYSSDEEDEYSSQEEDDDDELSEEDDDDESSEEEKNCLENEIECSHEAKDDKEYSPEGDNENSSDDTTPDDDDDTASDDDDDDTASDDEESNEYGICPSADNSCNNMNQVEILNEINALNQNMEEIIDYETSLCETRKGQIKTKRQHINSHLQTVGIKNAHRRCAIISTVQLLNILPITEKDLQQPEAIDEISFKNAALLLYNQLKQSTQVIDPLKCFEEFEKQNHLKEFANVLYNFISDINHSVLTTLLETIPRHLFKFRLQNHELVMLMTNLNNFEDSFKNVDISSLKKFLLMENIHHSHPFTYPKQFELSKQGSSDKLLLILKVIIINRPLHFVTYIRSQFNDEFILANDSKIINTSFPEDPNDLLYGSVACYYVFPL